MYLLLGENKKYRHLNDIALDNLSNNKLYKNTSRWIYSV